MSTRITRTAPGHLQPLSSGEPIEGLRDLATERIYRFPSGKKWIVIGAAPECDISLADSCTSAHHCLIERRGPRRIWVHDTGSKNGTLVNHGAVRSAELAADGVLTIGSVSFVQHTATGLHAPTLRTMLERAIQVHGSMRRAARALGVARSTLGDWLRRGRQ